MDTAILERFKLPQPYGSHAAVAVRGQGSDHERTRRINRVMPSMTKLANRFRAGLRPRERNNFDLDDVLQEIWTELWFKDGHYKPERSKYITFATFIAKRKLGEIRNRWHIVAGPRDTASRLREADAQGEAIEKVRQTVREAASLAAEPADLFDGSLSPDREIARHEEFTRADRMLRLVIDQLPGRHAYVIRRLCGLGQCGPMEVGELADQMGLSPAQVLAIRDEAEAELRRCAGDMGWTGVDLDVA